MPDHLKSNFRHLDRVCFRLKSKYPNLRRSIKFDDEALDLVADFKLDDWKPWQRITPEEAKQSKPAESQPTSQGPSRVSAAGLTSLFDKAPTPTASDAMS